MDEAVAFTIKAVETAVSPLEEVAAEEVARLEVRAGMGKDGGCCASQGCTACVTLRRERSRGWAGSQRVLGPAAPAVLLLLAVLAVL